MKSKKSSANVPVLYRQGDVAIERITALPPSLNRVPLESGKVILAHGEVTGHHHAFADVDCTKFTDSSGAEFFDVRGREMSFTLPVIRRWKNQVMISHPLHGMIEFAVADVAITDGHVTVSGKFGLLRHDEHNTHGIPAGIYKGAQIGNGTVRQREYHPESIRNVMD